MTVWGNMQVMGSAGSPNFQAYRLEYASATRPGDWFLITRSETPVSEDLLSYWNTRGLYGEYYTLRLVVEDAERGELMTFVTVYVGRGGSRQTEQEATPTPAPEAGQDGAISEGAGALLPGASGQ